MGPLQKSTLNALKTFKVLFLQLEKGEKFDYSQVP